jgi:hypothetical protein
METIEAETMQAARTRYFEDNRFGADGGYGDKWVDLKLGPLPFRIRNSAARVRAVRYHDLHHVATGYATDLPGELEISAWEIGAGCRDFAAAWVLNLGGMAAGLFRCPRRTFRAFVRGRHARSLYGRDLDALLVRTVDEVRAEMGLAPGGAPARPTAGDVALHALATAAGLAVGLVMLPLGLALGPIGALAAPPQTAPAVARRG